MKLLSKFVVIACLFLAVSIAHGQQRPIIDDSANFQPLEHYELSSLRFVTFHRFLFWKSAKILSPDGKIHTVRRGTYIGKNLGRVTNITSKLIQLNQTVPDGSGGYKEISTEIKIE